MSRSTGQSAASATMGEEASGHPPFLSTSLGSWQQDGLARQGLEACLPGRIPEAARLGIDEKWGACLGDSSHHCYNLSDKSDTRRHCSWLTV